MSNWQKLMKAIYLLLCESAPGGQRGTCGVMLCFYIISLRHILSLNLSHWSSSVAGLLLLGVLLFLHLQSEGYRIIPLSVSLSWALWIPVLINAYKLTMLLQPSLYQESCLPYLTQVWINWLYANCFFF